MFRKSRFYVSSIFTFLVLFSLLVTSNVRACEDIPQTLLSVYMNSELVVFATYQSNGAMTKSNEDEYGYSIDAERNLLIDKVLKGPEDLKNVTFSNYEYHSNQTEPIEISDGEYNHYDEDYFDVTKMKLGNKYLVFLTKDKESGKYSISDYSSGVKDVAGKFDLYEKSLNELRSIVAEKTNQKARLTEWIVKNIEEPEFRLDGVRDLAESFYSVNYQNESPELKVDGPFVFNEDYSSYTVGVALALSESQNARISSALYPVLQESWFAAKPVYVDYSISTILGSINKSRLAVHTYNMMKSVDKNDSARKMIIMEFLNDTVSDQALAEIYYEYVGVENELSELTKDNSAKTKLLVKSKTEKRNALLRDFDKRFRLMHQRNFMPVENANS